MLGASLLLLAYAVDGSVSRVDGAMLFALCSLLAALTAYMPALIFVNGKVSLGHIAAGYGGLLLVGAATLSLGVLGSALSRNQTCPLPS